MGILQAVSIHTLCCSVISILNWPSTPKCYGNHYCLGVGSVFKCIPHTASFSSPFIPHSDWVHYSGSLAPFLLVVGLGLGAGGWFSGRHAVCQASAVLVDSSDVCHWLPSVLWCNCWLAECGHTSGDELLSLMIEAIPYHCRMSLLQMWSKRVTLLIHCSIFVSKALRWHSVSFVAGQHSAP